MDLNTFCRDRVIADLIASENYKQALKNVDKKLKKSANDPYLLTLKATIHLRNDEYHESRAIVNSLLSRKLSDSPLDVIIQLYDCACALTRLPGHHVDPQTSENLWQNAIKAKQKSADQIDVAEEWAHQAIATRQWLHVAKAAQTLQRLYPPASKEARAYYYWQIAAHNCAKSLIMYGHEPRIIELSGNLALKMTERAIAQTPELPDTTGQTTGVWIASQADMDLAWQTIKIHNRPAQWLALLEQDKFKRASGDVYDRELRILLSLQQMGDALGVWEHASTLLRNSFTCAAPWPADDWKYWNQGILESEKRAKDVKLIEATETLVDDAIKSNSRLRGPFKAHLRRNRNALHLEEDNLPAGDYDKSTVKLYTEYFRKYRFQKFYPQDIRDFPWLSSLQVYAKIHRLNEKCVKAEKPARDSHGQDQLKWIVAETNSLRTDYNLFVGKYFEHARSAEGAESDSARVAACAVLDIFICNCLRLYGVARQHTARLPPTDMDPSDDVCLLAVESLLLLWEVGASQRPLVQAALLLEYAVSQSPQNFRLRIALVEMLFRLCCFNKMWTDYNTLTVKEVLHEHMSPLAFYRISCAHPFSSSEFDPYEEMDVPLRFYDKAISKVPAFIGMALEFGNYAQMRELGEFADRLRASETRKLLYYEKRRIARLRGKAYSGLDLVFDRYDDGAYKQERFSTVKLDNVLGISERIVAENYLIMLELLDDVHTLLLSGKPPTEEQSANLRKPIADLDLSNVADRSSFRVAKGLRSFLADCHDPDVSPESLNTHLRLLKVVVAQFDSASYTDIATDQLTHDGPMPLLTGLSVCRMFQELEALSILRKAAELVSGKLRRMSGQDGHVKLTATVKVIQNCVPQQHEKIRNAVSRYKNALDQMDDRDPGLLDWLSTPKQTDRPQRITENLLDVCGSSFLRKTGRMCIQSIHDALDGVLALKL